MIGDFHDFTWNTSCSKCEFIMYASIYRSIKLLYGKVQFSLFEWEIDYRNVEWSVATKLGTVISILSD